ncbi:MAG: hypothetical protein QM820_60345 [Minicystis sp.]
MILETYTRPLDVPPQGHDRVCIDRVHRNPNPDPNLAARCLRRPVHGLSGLPLSHSVPRPNFSSVTFCRSCHSSGAHLDALSLDALQPGSVPREEDDRRQPLDVPAFLFGRVPVRSNGMPQGQLVTPSPLNAGLPLDQFFDNKPKITP